MLLQMTRFRSFYDSVVFQPHLFYPFICCWTLSLLPYLDNYKQCCNEHWTCIFSNYCLFNFSILDLYPGVELLGHIVVLFLVQSFFGGDPPNQSLQFSTVAAAVYSQQGYEGSLSPHPSHICYFSFIDDKHFDRSMVISHLNFPDD